MQTPTYRLAHYHQEDLGHAAAASALRAEARRTATEGLDPRQASRELVFRPSIVRRMVARLAV